MSSTAYPFGLNPIRHQNGKFVPPPQAFPGGLSTAYGTALYYRAPVILNSSGNIVVATTNADIIGVFAGVSYVSSATGLYTQSQSWVASTAFVAGTLTAWVWTDPGIIYEMQANGSLAATSVGDQADFVNPGSGTPANALGASTTALSTTLAGAGVQAQMRIIGLSSRIDNAWGDAYTIVETQIARQEYVSNKVAV